MTELHYLSLFVRAIAKVLVMTGLGPGIVIAILAEKFRVVEVGIEKVSVLKFRGRAVSQANDSMLTPLSRATSSPREIRRCA